MTLRSSSSSWIIPGSTFSLFLLLSSWRVFWRASARLMCESIETRCSNKHHNAKLLTPVGNHPVIPLDRFPRMKSLKSYSPRLTLSFSQLPPPFLCARPLARLLITGFRKKRKWERNCMKIHSCRSAIASGNACNFVAQRHSTWKDTKIPRGFASNEGRMSVFTKRFSPTLPGRYNLEFLYKEDFKD